MEIKRFGNIEGKTMMLLHGNLFNNNFIIT